MKMPKITATTTAHPNFKAVVRTLPHLGHLEAVELISLPHSAHLTSAISTSTVNGFVPA